MRIIPENIIMLLGCNPFFKNTCFRKLRMPCKRANLSFFIARKLAFEYLYG